MRELRSKEKYKSESSGPLRGEMPEVVAASGSRATILPKWPHFSLPPTEKRSKEIFLPDERELGFVPAARFTPIDDGTVGAVKCVRASGKHKSVQLTRRIRVQIDSCIRVSAKDGRGALC